MDRKAVLKSVYLIWMFVILFFYAKLYVIPKFCGVLGRFGWGIR